MTRKKRRYCLYLEGKLDGRDGGETMAETMLHSEEKDMNSHSTYMIQV